MKWIQKNFKVNLKDIIYKIREKMLGIENTNSGRSKRI